MGMRPQCYHLPLVGTEEKCKGLKGEWEEKVAAVEIR